MGYRFKVSLISFVFSFMFFFPVGVFFAIRFFYDFNYNAKSVDKFQFLVPKEYDLNILFVNCSQNEDRNVADVFLLFKISAHDNSISLLSIPVNLKMVVQNRIFGLKDFFEVGGVKYAKKAIENFLTIQIDRTIVANDEAVKGAINYLHGLKLDLNDENNKFFTKKLPVVGKDRVIGGDYFCEILKKDPVKAFLLLKYMFVNSANLVKFFAYFANMFISNVTAYDFKIRKNSFENMILKKNATVILPKLEIRNFEGRHILTNLSKQSCSRAFKKI